MVDPDISTIYCCQLFFFLLSFGGGGEYGVLQHKRGVKDCSWVQGGPLSFVIVSHFLGTIFSATPSTP